MTIELMTPIEFLSSVTTPLSVEQVEAFIDGQPDTLYTVSELAETLEMIRVSI